MGGGLAMFPEDRPLAEDFECGEVTIDGETKPVWRREVYFDQADRVRDRLTAARHRARRARIEANRRELCRVFPPRTQRSVSVNNAVANAPP
jgi:hypothetical protein